jgi:polyisoprenoid-binding protein YceI
MRSILTWMAMALVAPALIAASPRATQVELEPESKLWVDGTSSVRGWSCRATAMAAAIRAEGSTATAAILRQEKAISGVDLTIPVAQLECGNGTMNGHMRKALKLDEHPHITFRLASYDLATAGDTLRVTLTGDLTMAGSTQAVTLTATGQAAGSGMLRVQGTHELLMTEFGIKPPSLMFGTMKVHDKVRVGFDLILSD